MKYPTLILPKKHLSWSQLSCWLSNKTRYRREYFEGGKKLDTKFLRFGKNIAQLIEEGRHKELLPDLETYDSPEFEVTATIMDIVPCLSFLDTYDSTRHIFREYKTGKIAWTKSKVQKHDQLVFYATILKWALGKGIPEYCDLDWIETREEAQEEVAFFNQSSKILNVTGRIISFHREFDEREIERMEQLIVKVAWEISDAYQDYIAEL